jgi:hypothetical protein
VVGHCRLSRELPASRFCLLKKKKHRGEIPIYYLVVLRVALVQSTVPVRAHFSIFPYWYCTIDLNANVGYRYYSEYEAL